MLHHRRLLASPRPVTPTRAVDWAGLGIALVRDHTDWPYDGEAYAGVSTCGLSGTFVHVVLGEPPVHAE